MQNKQGLIERGRVYCLVEPQDASSSQLFYV